jgi:RNA polymerase-interacting CarD/CdnL/TRCF family regulator
MAEPSPLMSLAVGDRVVYPNQGVCKVVSVDAKEVAGQKLTFVTMKREEDGATVMVPQGKLVSVGVRKVASGDDLSKIFAFLKSDGDKTDLDWKQRARANSDRMTGGGIMGMAEVVKGLQTLSELRPLPNKERELYDNARHLLIEEMSASMGISNADAEDAIDLALFPPGRERPKRTAAEFKGGEDELGLADDLGSEDEGSEEEVAEEAEGEEDGAPVRKKPVELSDDEVTKTVAALRPALSDDALPAPKRRGRPPKERPPVDLNAPPPVPKKRGRPPKPKPLEPPGPPKKRGRPPKNPVAVAAAAAPAVDEPTVTKSGTKKKK